MILELELLNTGKKDLSAAQALYDTEHYSNAIFMLQQAVEKCIKSYGITIKIIDEAALANKINHSAYKIFTREVKAKLDKLKEYNNTTILIPELIPPHQRVKSNDEEKIATLKRFYEKLNFVNVNELENLTEEELRSFIISVRLFNIKPVEDEQKIFNHFKDDWIKTNEHFLNYFSTLFSGKELDGLLESVNFSLKNADYFAGNKVANYKYELEKSQVDNHLILVWFNLSIATTPHEQRSRYPSSKSRSLNEIYNSEHILVKYFPDIIYIMEKSIEHYERIYFPN